MRDLIEALRRIENSNLPDNPYEYLSDNPSAMSTIPGGRVLLDRIEDLADRFLYFTSGRFQGKPDYYHHEVLSDAGYRVTETPVDEFGMSRGGVIHTRKGKIFFG